MIDDRDRREIEAAAARYPTRRAAGIESLQVVQKNHGWVSDEDLRAVASFLGIAPDELDGVASFYPMLFRKPVGRHVVLVCDSICCWILGYEAVLERLMARLGIRPGETSADGRFTLITSPCLGACDRSPALMIDGDLHGDLTPEKVDSLLEGYE
jgi:NADH-quinone oxidoreductase subunit E